MKKTFISLALSLTLLLTIALQAFTSWAGNAGTPDVKKADSITYIDIGIYQPNVENCYEMSVADTVVKQDWLNVYPNPNSGQFTMEVNLQKASKSLDIHIYDIAGKLVFYEQNNINGSHFIQELNVGFLGKGVYFIRATSQPGNSFRTHRLIIF